MNSRVEEVVVQISRESARERARGFFLFRCLIPLFLFFLEIFISPTFSLKDLVLGFSVFLSLFLLWGSSELGTNGDERWVWFWFRRTHAAAAAAAALMRGTRGGVDIEARATRRSIERTPIYVFLFFKKGVARTKGRRCVQRV